MNEFRNKKILVTGGCGSIGSELVRQLLTYKPSEIRIFDNSESKQFQLQQKLHNFNILKPIIGDVRDRERLKFALKNVDLVFHAAALKHVPLCEFNPFEAVATNVYGTQNLIDLSIDEGVDKVISISTDKSVHPINTMGATKLLSEKLIITAGMSGHETIFCSVRFGNVLNSDGSVIPIFTKQIREKSPVTVTSAEMTRFFMSMHQAVNLVLKAAEKTKGGEIFILNMKSLRITDLAEIMIEELAPKFGHDPKDISIKFIGVRPGEKLHETLFTQEEAPFVSREGELFVLRDPISNPTFLYSNRGIRPNIKEHLCEFNSKSLKPLTKKEIKKVLKEEGIL